MCQFPAIPVTILTVGFNRKIGLTTNGFQYTWLLIQLHIRPGIVNGCQYRRPTEIYRSICEVFKPNNEPTSSFGLNIYSLLFPFILSIIKFSHRTTRQFCCKDNEGLAPRGSCNQHCKKDFSNQPWGYRFQKNHYS